MAILFLADVRSAIADIYKKDDKELICKPDRLAFAIKDGIPVMLAEEARRIPDTVEIK